MKRKNEIIKEKGRVYTPVFIVCTLLDLVGYNGVDVLKKNIIDNSCGDGAFLVEAVKRYCEIAIQQHIAIEDLKKDLENHIFGIELDVKECSRCIQRLNESSAVYGLKNVNWNIISDDSLVVEKYNKMMDFVVGNPPYVRIHNLNNLEQIRIFNFTKKGMTDLYIAFFEIGIKMLNNTGILGYVTPSSYFTSKSGYIMREYFLSHCLLQKIVNFKHNKVFNESTYTCLTVLKKDNSKKVIDYYEYNLDGKNLTYIDTLAYNDFFIDNCFYFSTKEKLERLKKILLYIPLFQDDIIQVKNGFATLCDSFFIQNNFRFEDYVIPVLKASTGKWKKCFFPYENGKLISFKKLKENKNIENYYSLNDKVLRNRNLENSEEWWGFGRSQGIQDVKKKNTLLILY